jgi:hypothetical protein
MHDVGESGDLIEFAFESQVADDLTSDGFARLVRQSWSFNVRTGLTGELRLQDGRFVQILEGRCATILELAARILSDHRHGGIRILAFRALPVRRFAAWTVSGFDLGGTHEGAVYPTPANLRFMPARVATRLLGVGRPAS